MSAQQLKNIATGLAPTAEAEPRNAYEGLRQQLEKSKAEFLPLMGRSMENVDRFVRVVLNAVMSNPDLLRADRRSLIASCMRAAQDGLMPDGREAVLNIYRTKVNRTGRDEWVDAVQYLPMVGGLIKKLYAGGEITYLDAACVYERDRFRFTRGESPVLEHEPTMADDPGRVVAAYAVIKLANGEVKREVMPRRDIEKARGASKAGESANGPWVKWYDQMAIKSVLHRVYKQLPKVDEFERVAQADNEALGFAGTPDTVADIVASKPGATPDPVTGEIAAPQLTNDPSPTLDVGDLTKSKARAPAQASETKAEQQTLADATA